MINQFSKTWHKLRLKLHQIFTEADAGKMAEVGQSRSLGRFIMSISWTFYDKSLLNSGKPNLISFPAFLKKNIVRSIKVSVGVGDNNRDFIHYAQSLACHFPSKHILLIDAFFISWCRNSKIENILNQ